MKSQNKILIAFLLNLIFSAFEFIGGILTGSFAILSDSIHDLGDAGSIGISFLLEKKSTKTPDKNYTYGYKRYSVIGSTIMTLILILGSITIIYNAVKRIITPSDINHNGMIVLAVIGIAINLIATLVTRDGGSLNEKAVNLHMLEDVLGWAIVLIGAIVIKFTEITIIDPLLSICVALFVLISATRTLAESMSVFLEKTPKIVSVEDIRLCLLGINGVCDVHHIHLWSMDGIDNYATMHIVTDKEHCLIKEKVKKELKKHNINHSTLELEGATEECFDKHCTISKSSKKHSNHHHHH